MSSYGAANSSSLMSQGGGAAPSAGAISFITTGIDQTENTTAEVVLLRSIGTVGAITATLTSSIGTTPLVRTLTWATGDAGQKSTTFDLDEVGADAFGGSITLTVSAGTISGANSIPVTIRNTAVAETPGQIGFGGWQYILANEHTSQDMVFTRTGGDDGAIAADWTFVPRLGSPATIQPMNGVIAFPNNNTTQVIQSILLGESPSGTVAGDVVLSNPRRTDGGTVLPTLGAPMPVGITSVSSGEVFISSASTYSGEEGDFMQVDVSITEAIGNTTATLTVDDTNITFPSGLTYTVSWLSGASGVQSAIIPIGGIRFGTANQTATVTITSVTGSHTINQSDKTVTATISKKADIKVWDAGAYENADGTPLADVEYAKQQWLEDSFGIKKARVVYMTWLWPAGYAETADWSVIFPAHITALAAADYARGHRKAVLDVEYVEGRNRSSIYNLQGILSNPPVAPPELALGVTRLAEIIQAYKAGFTGVDGPGEVGMYDPCDFSSEYHRQLYLGLTASAATLQTYQRSIYAQVKPMVDAADFYVLSHYGTYDQYDSVWTGPAPTVPISDYFNYMGLSVQTAWNEAQLAFPRKPTVWFIRTSGPNQTLAGVDSYTTPAVRMPIEYPQWISERLMQYVPVGRRELYYWGGGIGNAAQNVSGWTNIELANMIRYGTINDNTADDASHITGYFYFARPGVPWTYRSPVVEVDENSNFTVTVRHAPAGAQASHLVRTVSITPPVGSITVGTNPASRTLTWGVDETGEKTTGNFTAAFVSADQNYTMTGLADATTVTNSGNGTAFNTAAAANMTLSVQNVTQPGTIALVTGATTINELVPVDITASRTGGAEGEVRVPLVFSNPSIMNLSAPEFIWTNGDTTNKTITVTGDVSTATVTQTMALGAATLGSPTVNQTPVNFTVTYVPGAATPGTITLTNANITVSNGQTFTLAFTRTGGTSGTVSAVARISPNIANSGGVAAVQVQFADGSTTPTYPFTQPTFTTTAAGTATITMDTPTGTLGAPLLSGYPKTLTVNAVQSTGDYTVATVQERHPAPFAWATPVAVAALPTTTQTITVSPTGTGNGATHTLAAALAINGAKILLTAGHYSRIVITGNNQEIVFTTGVSTDELRIDPGVHHIKVTANPIRSGTTGTIRITDAELTATSAAQDITLDGIVQYYTGVGGGTTGILAPQDNRITAQRLVVINCKWTQRSFLWVSFSNPGGGRLQDVIIANNEFIDGGAAMFGGTAQGESCFRTQGATRIVNVDNRWVSQGHLTSAQDGYHLIRIHDQAGQKGEYHYMRKNQFEGTGHSFQGWNADARVDWIWYLDNLQYCNKDQAVHTLDTVVGPINYTQTGNTLYSTNNYAYPTLALKPPAGTWTVTPNTQTLGQAWPTVRPWTFDTWKADARYSTSNIQERYPLPFTAPFSHQLPLLPVTSGGEIEVLSTNFATQTVTNGRVYRLKPGNYGTVVIDGNNKDFILEDGVYFDSIRWHQNIDRVRVRCESILGAYTTNANFEWPSQSAATSDPLTNLTIDGLDFRDRNRGDVYSHAIHWIGRRLLVMNSKVQCRDAAVVCWEGFTENFTVANCEIKTMNQSDNLTDPPNPDGSFIQRMQACLRTLFVDNRFYHYPDVGSHGSLRFHCAASGVAETQYVYVGGNQIEGNWHSFQAHPYGTDMTGQSHRLRDLWFNCNSDYRFLQAGSSNNARINNGTNTAAIPSPVNFNVSHNRGYNTPGTASNSWFSNAASVATNVNNTIVAGTQNPPAWTFDTWKTFDPLLNEPPPN
jgi:hypothetical protein